MERAKNIKYELIKNFSFLQDRITIQRQRRVFADVPVGDVHDVLKYLKDKQDFTFLCAITGLDMGENFQVIYHLADSQGSVVSLKILTPRSHPAIKSVTPLFEGAVFYERELRDMFGIEVEGVPPGRRYPLPDDWPEGQYPLRKDWKQEEESKAPEE
jgi:membrane-bound hydrogenase subunit beta